MNDNRLKITDVPLAEIAKLIGGTADLRDALDHGGYIVMPTFRLWVRVDHRKARLEISLSLPHGRGSGGPLSVSDVLTYDERKAGTFRAEVTVDAKKSADAIAKDLNRRLIPQCVELTERALKVYEQREANARALTTTVEKFVKGFRYERSGQDSGYVWARGDLPHLNISSDSVRFNNFYCDVPTAFQILALLQAPQRKSK